MAGSAEPGPWGPTIHGGRRFRLLARLLVVVGVVAMVGTTAAATTAAMLAQRFETNLERVPVPELEEPVARSGARHFLLVGSDARDGLSAQDRAELTLGDFEGQRSDTMIYVSISEDRETVSLLSLPRDLRVRDGDRVRKLTDTFDGGPDKLVRVIRENLGLPVNHYAQVSLGGFIDVVRTLGGVEMCPSEPLVDPKSGADFEAGCQGFDATEALAYVRSRSSSSGRGDFERIDRQQEFLRAVVSELTDARVLTNPRQLGRLVEDLSSTVTTDEALELTQMLGLADEMRQVVADGLPMATLPGYTRTIGTANYVIAYGPGTRAMVEDLRAGRPLEDNGTREQRAGTVIALASAGRVQGYEILGDTLLYAAFDARGFGPGAEEIDPGATTTVYQLPGQRQRAEWVAATLGAPIESLPDGVDVPDEAHVVVSTGEDATT